MKNKEKVYFKLARKIKSLKLSQRSIKLIEYYNRWKGRKRRITFEKEYRNSKHTDVETWQQVIWMRQCNTRRQYGYKDNVSEISCNLAASYNLDV